MTSQISHEIDPLLDFLKRNRGFDFTGYKRASLERRIRRRMAAVQQGTYEEYTDYLEVHPEEFGQACAFLCGAKSGFITGQNILLDGGAFPGTL